MFSLPFPSISSKTIFQIHMERLLTIRRLTKANSVPVYIMTSDLNDEIIRNYFKENNYFGYPETDIYFFQQGLIPCFDLNGKIIIESPQSLSLAPDGNGGMYEALQHTGKSSISLASVSVCKCSVIEKYNVFPVLYTQ